MRPLVQLWRGLAVATALLCSCGHTTEGGEGSETHWLQACESNEGCQAGECLCGVCTVACDTVRDCPAPLDTCSAGSREDALCPQTICQSAASAPSEQTLSVQTPPETELFSTCDMGRAGKVVLIDLADYALGPSFPGWSIASRIVADRQSGFLVFGGGDSSAFRISSDGEFVRYLRRPEFKTSVKIDQLLPLADGSVVLSGHKNDAGALQGWIGKMDADWAEAWELELDPSYLVWTDLAPLPDGGVIFAALGINPEQTRDSVYWARVGANGEIVWEREATVPGTPASIEERLNNFLTVDDQSLRLAVGSEAGITLISGDLDGGSEQALLQGGTLVTAARAVPGGRLAVLTDQQLLMLDETGQPLWEYALEVRNEHAYDLELDETRGELLIGAGVVNPNPATSLQALDLDGNPTWQLRRQPFPVDGYPPEETPLYGSPIEDLAVDAQGRLVFFKATGGRLLSLQWVGNRACGG